MTDRIRMGALVGVALLITSACDRTRQPPTMNAADLSDGRGARAGRFLPPVGNGADADNAMAANAADGNAP